VAIRRRPPIGALVLACPAGPEKPDLALLVVFGPAYGSREAENE